MITRRPAAPAMHGSQRCACAAFRRAGRAITQLYDAVLAPTKLKATQFITLHTIDTYGDVAQWQLAQDQAIAVETLSRRLGGLRRRGWLQQDIRGSHHEHIYRLTSEGKRVLQAAMPYWERAQERFLAASGHDDLRTLIHLAESITTSARKAEHLKMANRPSMRPPAVR